MQHFLRSICYADVTQMLMNFNLSNCCIIALLHNFMSEFFFSVKTHNEITPPKLPKI